MAKFLVQGNKFDTSDSLIFMYYVNLTCSRIVYVVEWLLLSTEEYIVFAINLKLIIYFHQIFTFWHQVLLDDIYRFRTKKYLVFAPKPFFILTIVELNVNVVAPCNEFWCVNDTNTSQFWCENVTIYFQNRYNKK